MKRRMDQLRHRPNAALADGNEQLGGQGQGSQTWGGVSQRRGGQGYTKKKIREKGQKGRGREGIAFGG